MRELIERLTGSRHWLPGELHPSAGVPGEDLDFPHAKARAVAQSHFGNRIYIRGLIEIGELLSQRLFLLRHPKSNRHLKRHRRIGNHSGLLPTWIRVGIPYLRPARRRR